MFSSSKVPFDHICFSFRLAASTDKGAELPSNALVLAISDVLRWRGKQERIWRFQQGYNRFSGDWGMFQPGEDTTFAAPPGYHFSD